MKDKYRKNRSKCVLVQSVILIILTLLVLVCSITYGYISKTYYVSYAERGNANYTVQLKDNEFYSSKYQEKDNTYVGALIDGIIVDLSYDMNADDKDVYFDYSYSVMANLQIVDKYSSEPIFDNEYVLIPEKRAAHSTNNPLHIGELVILDYNQYNDLANRFVSTYDLNDTENVLVVTLNVNIYGSGAAIGSTTTNGHITSLEIPLTDKTVDIKEISPAPSQAPKTIACDAGSGKEFFKIFAIIVGIIDVIAAAFLVAFIFITRTNDISYAAKQKKLISRYKSYIQKILTPFDMCGYQVLRVDTFDEMLEIRDTIQEPILMHENEDKTCTRFIIPTNTMLLYLYTLAVDDFEDIYGHSPEPEVITFSPEETIMTDEPHEEPSVITDEPHEVEEIIEEVAEPATDEPYNILGAEKLNDDIEVIGVVWPESRDGKIYNYDPDGETVGVGDTVLVPTRDVARGKDIIREAEVKEPNHNVPADVVSYPLKKIIRVVKRKAEEVFTNMIMGDGSKS